MCNNVILPMNILFCSGLISGKLYLLLFNFVDVLERFNSLLSLCCSPRCLILKIFYIIWWSKPSVNSLKFICETWWIPSSVSNCSIFPLPVSIGIFGTQRISTCLYWKLIAVLVAWKKSVGKIWLDIPSCICIVSVHKNVVHCSARSRSVTVHRTNKMIRNKTWNKIQQVSQRTKMKLWGEWMIRSFLGKWTSILFIFPHLIIGISF